MSQEYFTAKSIEQWRKVNVSLLPKGESWEGANVQGKNHYAVYKALATIWNRFDQYIEKKLNRFYLDENCEFLDQWWDNLELSRFITKPTDKTLLVNLIKFMMQARGGIFTATDLENLVTDIFGLDITITVLDANEVNLNVFPLTFPFVFTASSELTNKNYKVIIKFPATTGMEDYKTAIKEILKYLINVNYTISYMDNDDLI